ncbi:FkbM family methyltransferase [Halobacterium salinarum]|uniref:FkbM family methyltransferase n=1 Tax=Halobacterium salinarum TaxID=2242 RepID=UPI001F31D5A7|nr:FkbM family methyltransferase [Halobacterium salinarum]MCF2238155.1 FkbM family methyltransferase [Halobacterium salinarum]
MIKRAVEIVRQRGVGVLIKKIPPYIYQQVWPYLPSAGYTYKNGIKSCERGRVLDQFLPKYITQYATHQPSYESQYIEAIRRHVTEGQDVVLVGGGEGISTVVAANQVQRTGEVTVFEGAAEEARKSQVVVEINEVSDRTTVHHTIVSEDVSLRSAASGAEVLPSAELPSCDVLAIDADGAEISILDGIVNHPAVLIVEHHAVADTSGLALEYQPDRVRDLITNLGYDIVDEMSDPAGAGGGQFEERIYVGKRLAVEPSDLM